MNVDPNKWVNTLPNKKIKFDQKENELNPNVWVNTIPKTNLNNPIKKYSITFMLFFIGIIFVSLIKNETRLVQKEINILEKSIDSIKFDLHQARLDHEVITSPENISKLAKEHLDFELTYYEKSQIKHIEEKVNLVAKLPQNKIKKETNVKKIKLKVEKEIKKKKTELKKLQEIYSQPEKLPDEVKSHIAKRIEQKKHELKKLASNPKDAITLERVQRWAAVQVVKVFFGMPIIPGK